MPRRTILAAIVAVLLAVPRLWVADAAPPLLVPTPAVKPAKSMSPPATAWFVEVDLIVVNRVRSYATSYDAWGRPRIIVSERWWVSFWDDLPPVVVIPTPGLRIDRGYWLMDQVVHISRASGGWIVESKGGINVIAARFWFIDSHYDWEMRNRRIFRPIRKP